MSNKRELKFDEIMGFDGAFQILKTQGFDALAKELTRRGLSHKSLQFDQMSDEEIEDLLDSRLLTEDENEALLAAMGWPRRRKFSVDVERGGSSLMDVPDTPIDESLLIEDDAERLAAKANKLGVSEQAHTRLLKVLSTAQLERVYNRAGAHEKQMSEDEHRELLLFQTRKLLPESVMDALAKELGDSLFYHVLEDLRLSLVFGPHLVPKAYTPPNRTPINHPTFGPAKEKATPAPGTHPTFGVAYKPR